jgi:hypothetical protein
MSTESLRAQVLNGTVGVGDKIAYATRTGSSMDMNIGTVTDVSEREHPWRSGVTTFALKVNVTESTDTYTLPRNVTITVIDRVVKLS